MRFFGRRPPDPERLARDLTEDRRRTDVRRGHHVASRGDEVHHSVVEGRLSVRSVAASQRTQAETQTAQDLARESGRFWRLVFQGMAARNRWAVNASGEVRSLRLTALSRWSLYLLLPAMAALGVWSMTGVQAGLSILLHLESGSAGWWAAWLLEPVIIAVVAFVILAKSILRRNGGSIRSSLHRAEWLALTTSIVLNAVPAVVAIVPSLSWTGGWNIAGSVSVTAFAVLGHSIGTLGCAFLAWLVGVIDEHVADARPWDNAPSIRDLTLDIPTLDELRNPYEELLAQLERRAEAEQHGQRPAVQARATRDDEGQGDAAAPAGLTAGPPVAKIPGPAPQEPPSWPVVDDLPELPATAIPPPAEPAVAVPDEIPDDWAERYGSRDDQGGSVEGGALATVDRPAGRPDIPGEWADDIRAFLAGLEAAETSEVTRARAAAYLAAREALADGQTRIDAARAYIAVIERSGGTWSPTEVARAAGLASRAQLYRLRRDGDQDATDD